MQSFANKLQVIRERELVSPRTMTRRLQITTPQYALLESPDHDLTVRELLACCEALNIPPREFFVDEEAVPIRAKILRAYKSALTLKRLTKTRAENVIADRLCDDLLKLMPEMAGVRDDPHTGVKNWHAGGHRRDANEPSKREEFPIDTSLWSASPISEFATH